ncbi:DUF1853 family protein [Christiangramia aquimixticola]|uniref:DUF1853 family protein n=1 Tax=Christiangramia aquimixticola TaxID=1697558 RepID=UPI003AA9D172
MKESVPARTELYISQFQGFLKTPDINAGTNSSIPVFEFPEIEFSESLYSRLAELDHPRNSILGKRMESFFEIAIEHSPRYDLIAANLQIISENTTCGELDFLVYDHKTSKPLHVELVYKLYVYDPNFETEAEKWIGPNRRDSFKEKMDKLQKKQFPLLFREETSTYLNKLGLKPENIEQQLCFKAQLYKREHDIADLQLINPEALIGSWISYEEFTGENRKNAVFYAPKKNEWSMLPNSNSNWEDYDTILKQIEDLFEKGKSPLIWMKHGDIYKKFFVVWW